MGQGESRRLHIAPAVIARIIDPRRLIGGIMLMIEHSVCDRRRCAGSTCRWRIDDVEEAFLLARRASPSCRLVQHIEQHGRRRRIQVPDIVRYLLIVPGTVPVLACTATMEVV